MSGNVHSDVGGGGGGETKNQVRDSIVQYCKYSKEDYESAFKIKSEINCNK